MLDCSPFERLLWFSFYTWEGLSCLQRLPSYLRFRDTPNGEQFDCFVCSFVFLIISMNEYIPVHTVSFSSISSKPFYLCKRYCCHQYIDGKHDGCPCHKQEVVTVFWWWYCFLRYLLDIPGWLWTCACSSFCLSFWSAGIKGIYLHTWLQVYVKLNVYIVWMILMFCIIFT